MFCLVQSPQVRTRTPQLEGFMCCLVQSRKSSSGQLEKHEPPQVQRRNTSLQKWLVGEIWAAQEQRRNTSLLKGSVATVSLRNSYLGQSGEVGVEVLGFRALGAAFRVEGQLEKHEPPHVVSNFKGETRAPSMVQSPQLDQTIVPLNSQSPQLLIRSKLGGWGRGFRL